MNVGEGAGIKESSYSVGRNVNWCSRYEERWRYLKKLTIELPCDPLIPLWTYIPQKTLIQKGTCTPMSIAALFTTTKTWQQPKCPSTDEWIKTTWYVCVCVCVYRNAVLCYVTSVLSDSATHSTIKKKKRKNVTCSDVDGLRDYLPKWSISDRERQI